MKPTRLHDDPTAADDCKENEHATAATNVKSTENQTVKQTVCQRNLEIVVVNLLKHFMPMQIVATSDGVYDDFASRIVIFVEKIILLYGIIMCTPSQRRVSALHELERCSQHIMSQRALELNTMHSAAKIVLVLQKGDKPFSCTHFAHSFVAINALFEEQVRSLSRASNEQESAYSDDNDGNTNSYSALVDRE